MAANPKKTGSPEYEQFAKAFTKKNPDVELSAMFGMPCLKRNGKAIAGAFDGGTVFKLDEKTREVALKLKGAKLFDPSGMGRPMKEWVVVPAVHEKQWAKLAQAALAYALEKAH